MSTAAPRAGPRRHPGGPRRPAARWYGFDVQLAIYALLAHGHRPAHGLHQQRRSTRSQPGSHLHARARCGWPWRSSSSWPRAAADHHWLRTFAWPIYLLQPSALLVLDPGHRQRHRRRVALGLHLRAAVPVLGGRQDPAGRRAGRTTSPRGRPNVGQPRTIVGRRAHRAARCWRSCSSSPTWAPRSCSAPSSSARSSCPAPACAGWRPGVRGRAGHGARRLDGRPQGLPEAAPHLVPRPDRRPAGLGLPAASSRRSTVELGRAVRHGASPTALAGQIPARRRRPTSSSRASARSWASSAASSCWCSSRCSSGASCVVGWRSGDTFSAGLRRRPGAACCSSSCSSTSAWCWASCPSPASRCRS